MFCEQETLIIRGDEIVAIGVKQSNEICRLFFQVRIHPYVVEANVSTTSLKDWHEGLGHLNKRALFKLVSNGMVNGVKVTDKHDFSCDACQFGKCHRQPFKKIVERVSREPGECIYSDVCGTMSEKSIGGARFFVIYKDEASGFRQVYFVKHKSDRYENFKVFERAMTNKFWREMKILRTDNGGEYCNEKMKQYLQLRGIKHETMAPYTPEQNGRAERDIRTVVECARTMMQAKQLGVSFWAKAVNTAVYLLNRNSATEENVSQTPYEI